jgi:hypothetical protein
MYLTVSLIWLLLKRNCNLCNGADQDQLAHLDCLTVVCTVCHSDNLKKNESVNIMNGFVHIERWTRPLKILIDVKVSQLLFVKLHWLILLKCGHRMIIQRLFFKLDEKIQCYLYYNYFVHVFCQLLTAFSTGNFLMR